MPRIPRLLAAATAATALALPASIAGAALPKKGTFLNGSDRNGVRLETGRHHIKTIEFYCDGARWELVQDVRIRRDGSFSFSGKLNLYGEMSTPRGRRKAHFTGRFTSRKRVRITRTIHRCGTDTVKARRVKHG